MQKGALRWVSFPSIYSYDDFLGAACAPFDGPRHALVIESMGLPGARGEGANSLRKAERALAPAGSAARRGLALRFGARDPELCRGYLANRCARLPQELKN